MTKRRIAALALAGVLAAGSGGVALFNQVGFDSLEKVIEMFRSAGLHIAPEFSASSHPDIGKTLAFAMPR